MPDEWSALGTLDESRSIFQFLFSSFYFPIVHVPISIFAFSPYPTG